VDRSTATEPAGTFVEAGGVRLHYHELGRGDPVICLHGAGPGASAWSNFKANVDAFAAHHRTLLVDLPQYGRSEKVVITGGRLTFTGRVLDAFMDQLGIPSAHFVGNSMGGQVALKMAIETPRRIRRIAVLGASPISFSALTPLPVEGVRLIQSYYRGGGGPTRTKMRALMETLVSTPATITDEMVEERYAASAEPEVVALFTKTPPQNEDLFTDLVKVAAPTLVLWGQDDRFGALEVGLLLVKRLQNARLIVFPRCGHWAHVERAEEFNHYVLDFFAGR
jgi:2-hydroxy-6-oxonona-2,4-dienedioate hydrolase/4,5:9,10-diseco-3-hydroxy-5,9,17-trioxoandrosta-1(10),2-diene-4-oate hydrolase